MSWPGKSALFKIPVRTKLIRPITNCLFVNDKVSPKKKHITNGTMTIGGSTGYTKVYMIALMIPNMVDKTATKATSLASSCTSHTLTYDQQCYI
jgi:hypothetical protein